MQDRNYCLSSKLDNVVSSNEIPILNYLLRLQARLEHLQTSLNESHLLSQQDRSEHLSSQTETLSACLVVRFVAFAAPASQIGNSCFFSRTILAAAARLEHPSTFLSLILAASTSQNGTSSTFLETNMLICCVCKPDWNLCFFRIVICYVCKPD